jgi:peptide/nickel transport system substrate-binding protein
LAALLKLGAAVTVSAGSTTALGLGRIPYSGALQLSLPHAVHSIDPHDATDPFAALFADALFEPLYGTDALGRVYPRIAAALPAPHALGAVVALRQNLTTGYGRKLSASDLLFSLRRSRERSGGSVLSRFGEPRLAPDNRESVLFPQTSTTELAQALSSPLTAVVPRGFDPKKPEGCGAFSATLGPRSATFTRNQHAARGPAYLESITFSTRDSLAECLRDFEKGISNVGWLGRGLHRPRSGTRLVEGETGAWVVLHSGRAAGLWGLPGSAGQLLRSLDPAQLSRFGLRLPTRHPTPAQYGGPSCYIFARDDSGYLFELGNAVAGLLSSSTATLTLKTVPASELSAIKRSGDFGFILEVLRQSGPSNSEKQLSLLHAVDPKLSARPPRHSGDDVVSTTTRTLPLGVVGEMLMTVALESAIQTPSSFRLGELWFRTGT